MKIFGSNNIKGGAEGKSIDAAKVKGGKREEVPESPLLRGSSTVSLSEKSRSYNKIRKAAEDSPDVRADKVKKYKDLIARGEYKVDSGKLADAIIKETFENEILSRKIQPDID